MRNTTESPVNAYIAAIHERFVSVPANTPWPSARAKAGTAARWIARHSRTPIGFRSHELTMITTMANIAAIPNETGIGR